MLADDDVRSRVAKRVASEEAPLSTSALGRRARWIGGLAKAGAKSIGRSVKRAAGRDASDVDAEAEIVASLGELKGPMMKMGQVLGAIDVGLPEPLRVALSALHAGAQAVDPSWLRRVLDEDLGDPGHALARSLEPVALSAASVGQVHRAALPDGTAVAVKVLHPRVSTAVQRDLAPAMLASRLSSAVHSMVTQIRDRLLEECDYHLEARRQERFAEIFAGHPVIVVPAVHRAYSSPRVLTTSFVEGVHLDAFLASRPSPAARNRAGEALFDFYVAPLFTHGVYNCDPHPGNYLFLADGRVAFVDFGCVREFDPSFVERFAALTRAILAGDRDGMHDALVDLGLDERAGYDRDATWRLLRAFYGPLAQEGDVAFDWRAEISLRDALRSAWKARRAAASGELVFLLRTLLGLSSVLARLGARARWRARLEEVVATATSASVARARPQVVREEPTWDVVLVDAGASRIALIRELRELTRKDLRDLETLLDSAPETLRTAVSRVDAETIRQKLERAGARVEIRRAAAAW